MSLLEEYVELGEIARRHHALLMCAIGVEFADARNSTADGLSAICKQTCRLAILRTYAALPTPLP